MDNTKDKSSRSSSKVNLNESSVPLLDEEEVTLKAGDSKVTIEMDTRGGDDMDKDEKKEEEAKADGKTDSKEEKKKEKKEKKKEKKEKTHKRTSSFADRLTAGLNLLDRDDRNVNDHINVVFEDVLAEPDASQGFAGAWRLAFMTFTGVRLWLYRALAAVLAVPCAVVWGVLFALLTLLTVWVVSPALRTFDVLLYIVHRVWSGVVRTFLDPIFQSVGQVCSNININRRDQQVEV